MNITLLSFAVVCVACAGAPDAAETAKREAACEVVERSYTEAANGVIDSGACDKYDRIEQCPPYLGIETLYTASIRELRCQ